MDDPRQPNSELLDLPLSLKRDPATNKAEYMVMSDTEELQTKRVRLKPTKAEAKPKAEGKKAKASKTPVKPTKEKAKDQFGLRKGSARSEAAAMYARKSGATLAEIKERVGSTQLNVLTALEATGSYDVEKTVETRKGKRPITRYKLRAKN